MKKQVRKYILLVAPIMALWACWPGDNVQAQTLFPAPLESFPQDGATNPVLREQGRKGLLFKFKFFNADGITENDAAGFPLMATATVTLTIGANPEKTCTATVNPDPGECGYQIVAGTDDPALDTVKTFYNGDFPPSTQVQYSVTDARSAGMLPQSGDPHIVTFTTGNDTPRAPASIELVFDISGSMGQNVGGPGTVIRMAALKHATQSFFTMLKANARLGDKVGAVYFSSAETVFDPTAGGSNLKPAHDATQVDPIAGDVQARNPTFSTSIGAGLNAANNQGFVIDPPVPGGLAPARRIFLFSDGEQNTAPLVSVAGGNVQVNAVDYPAGIDICPITVGPLSGPAHTLQQSIAAARCGNNYPTNRQPDGRFVEASLATYFTQTLGSVLVGDKLEHVRNVTGALPPRTTVKERFQVNANDVALQLYLSWNGNPEPVRLRPSFSLRAPDGTVINTTGHVQFGRRMIFISLSLPLRQEGRLIHHRGEWTMELTGLNLQDTGEASIVLDYHLIVILDNANLASDFQLAGQDLGTGEPIKVSVKLSEDGRAIKGATVVAQVRGPGDGVGNILSRNQATGSQPPATGDPVRSEAQLKLLQLMADPRTASLFADRNLPSLVLLDNGRTANGDSVANDGVYSGIFTGAVQEGHYHFLVNVLGTTAKNGGFQRTQSLSVFVRPKPVAANTELTLVSRDVNSTGGMVVRIRATPRDRFNNFIGPDYLGALQIKSTQGAVSSPLQDRLNGSYEINYQLPASADPDFTLEVLGTEIVTKSLSELSKSEGARWSLGLLPLGVTTPSTGLTNDYRRGLSLSADLDYRVAGPLSIGIAYSHDRFERKAGGEDFYFNQLGFFLRVSSGGDLRVFGQIGPSVYFPAAAGSHPGFKMGVGVQYWFKPRWAFETQYNFHHIRFGNQYLRYGALQSGLRLAF